MTACSIAEGIATFWGRAKLRPSMTRIVRCPSLSSGSIFRGGGCGELVRDGTGVCDREGTSASFASAYYKKAGWLNQNSRPQHRTSANWHRQKCTDFCPTSATYADPAYRHLVKQCRADDVSFAPAPGIECRFTTRCGVGSGHLPSDYISS